MARAQALVLALTFQFCAPETETPVGKRARSLQAYSASARGAGDGLLRTSECGTLGRVLRVSVAAVSVVCVQAEVECVPGMRVCWCECRLRGAPGVRWLIFVHAAKWVVYLSFGGLARVASDPVLHLLAFLYSPGASAVAGAFENTRVCLCVCCEGSVDPARVWARGTCVCGVCACAVVGTRSEPVCLCAVPTSDPVGGSVWGVRCCVGRSECQGCGKCVWGSVSGVDECVGERWLGTLRD